MDGVNPSNVGVEVGLSVGPMCGRGWVCAGEDVFAYSCLFLVCAFAVHSFPRSLRVLEESKLKASCCVPSFTILHSLCEIVHQRCFDA